MYDWFIAQSPVLQAFLATTFTWFVTALGAAMVFFFRTLNLKLLDFMLGFAAGVMIAASYWSLLAPSIAMAEAQGMISWFPAVVGFLAGGFTIFIIDKILPHLHLGYPQSEAEGIKTSWERSVLLVLAITFHNFPEGLAVGVAFGAAGLGYPEATLGAAMALALGIGLQNFPEGLAVSVPLRREGMGHGRAFMYGQASGMVEPIAGILGALLVLTMQTILPYALAFAAGAMIFVVVEELIPESQRGHNTDLATLGTMGGFALMMLLDVALG
jgi:zinc transporter, ZIP family